MNLSDTHKLIHESNRSRVYYVQESEYNQPVVIKMVKNSALISSQATLHNNEYEITKDIQIEGVRKSLDRIELEHQPALVMAYFPGKTLKQMIHEKMTLTDALTVAVRIAQIINDLHYHKIIHRNIHCGNILVDPDTLQVQLIDFGLASRFNIKMEYSANPEVLSGDLHYIAPEQTGRMNRIVDYRSDLYSLGVVYYEMLTGLPPFESDDPLELVHAHMAKIPKPVKKIVLDIPPLISDIVAKLLAKNAEDRYQSASGLHADLQRCLTELKGADGRLSPESLSFELGRNDICRTFTLPQKLYGRSNEIAALLDAFYRVAGGSNELFIITGHPGIGKTSLVAEVYKPITQKRGYFIRGKFDQLRFNTPYSAFIQAFDQFIESLLNEPENVLQVFRNKINAALGDTGAVLTELIPRLEDIIGKQPPVPVLSGRDYRFRFNRTFQQFMGAISTAEHPLVFFIDDWQWADIASLELLETMFAKVVVGHLLVIMAYRDNEVSHSHPLTLTLSGLEKSGIRPNAIKLSLLAESDINMLVADALKCEPEAAWPLTRLAYRITRGNPFFNNQFLNMLHAEGAIVFDDPSNRWRYDITHVDKLNLTDDVVLFLAQQLEKLPQEIRDVLTLAACIGNQFDLEILSTVYQKSLDDTADILQHVLQEGLLIPPNEDDRAKKYRFIHDRVQQAAYSLVSEKERQHTHLIIGQLMLKNSAEDEFNENIFEIVNQLNQAKELQIDTISRLELSRLNFAAGQKAKSSEAFASAWSYFKIGLELLPGDCWQSQYSFTLELYESSIEVSFFCGDTASTHDLIYIVTQEAKTLLDTVLANDIKIQILAAENKFREAILTGLKHLKLMGIEFPEDISDEDVAAAFKESKLLYSGKNIKDFVNLPQMSDPLKLAAMQIMESLTGVAYLSLPNLHTLLILKRMTLLIHYGNFPTSALCFASIGLILCGKGGDIDAGVEFGELALDLLHRLKIKEFVSRIHLLVYGFVLHWKKSLQEMMAPIRTGFYTGLETGDFEFACYNAMVYSNYYLYAGLDKNLIELKQEILAFSKSLYQLKLMTIFQYLQIALQALQDLREGRSDSRYLQGEYYDEKSMLPQHLSAKDQTGLFYLYSYKLLVSYLFGDYEQAARDAEQARQYIASAKGMAHVPAFYLFDSLAAIEAYKIKSVDDVDQLILKIDANQEKLKNWAGYTPMNCLYKYDLVEAQRYYLLDEKDKAADYFKRAITGANENEYFRDEALANELAARFYFDWGKDITAQDHMQSAFQGYLRWGGTAKANQLKRNFPSLTTSVPVSQATQSDFVKKQGFESPIDSGISVPLDLVTVIKASHAITGEIKLERLLRQMLLIMFENAGAQRGALILKEAGEWVIQAQGDVGGDIEVLQAVKLRKSDQIAAGIVHEVARSRDSVLLDNASSVGDFIYDPYIARNKIKSIICIPLINQGELSAILYLENNLVTHAFTAKRLELLNLLSAQMALSLDNARLYQQAQIEIAERKQAEAEIEKLNRELEQRVIERTAQLEKANKELRVAQDELVKREKLAMLGQLTATVSHELRNPLGVIGSSNYYLRGKMKGRDPKTDKHFKRIDEQVYLCNSIVEELLEFTRRRGVSARKKSLAPLIGKVLEQFEEAGIEIKLHMADDIGPIAHDPEKMQRVMINLMTNAIQAVRAKAIEAAKQRQSYQPEIRVDVSQTADAQIIVVADNGVGMSAQVCQQAFEPLFTTRAQGTGIGLSNVKKIIEEHGGTVVLESAINQGAQIKLTLPFNSHCAGGSWCTGGS